MSVENDLFAALGPLVASRCYPLMFPQPAGGAAPVWPALRYTLVSSEVTPDVCGDGATAELPDKRVQIDAVDSTYEGMRTLRATVLTAMHSFAPPAVLDGEGETFDEPTRTFRARLDFVIYPSSTA